MKGGGKGDKSCKEVGGYLSPDGRKVWDPDEIHGDLLNCKVSSHNVSVKDDNLENHMPSPCSSDQEPLGDSQIDYQQPDLQVAILRAFNLSPLCARQQMVRSDARGGVKGRSCALGKGDDRTETSVRDCGRYRDRRYFKHLRDSQPQMITRATRYKRLL